MSNPRKTVCVISRSDFRKDAKPVKVTIGDQAYVAESKEFSTGSLGWNVSQKVRMEIGGKMVSVQIGLNLTIVGSKELPEEAATPPAPTIAVSAPAPALVAATA